MAKRINHADHTTVTLPQRGRMVPHDPSAGTMEKIDAGVLGDLRNFLESAPGVFCNGTTAPISIPNSYVWAVGTDDFSLYWKGALDDFTPAANKVLIDWVAANLGVRLTLLTTGVLRLQFGNGADLTTYQYDSTANLSGWDGLPVHIAVTCDRDGNVVFYVNGVQLGNAVSIAGSSAQTLTSTSVLRLMSDGTNHTAGHLFGGFSPLYNLALSAAEVLDIYLRGGRPPFKYRAGGQLINDTVADGDFTGTTTNHTTNGAGTVTLDTTNDELDVSGNGGADGSKLAKGYWGERAYVGQMYRVRCTIANYSGPGTASAIFDNIALTFFTVNANGAYSSTGIATTDAAGLTFGFRSANPGAWTISVKNLKIEAVGAVLFLPMDDAGGPQLRVEGQPPRSIKLDADLERDGATPLEFAPIGDTRQIRRTYAHSEISSTAATTSPGWLPAGWAVVEVQANVTTAFDASTTLDFGISGTANKYVNALAVSTTGFKRAPSSSLVPEHASAATTVYGKKNQATTAGAIEIVWLIQRIF